MNDAFSKISKEKQQRIISAAMEVFAKYEYKKASTEEIAIKAGISKGLLFHYFKNKRSLYIYLLKFQGEALSSYITIEEIQSHRDFFELIKLVSKKKAMLMVKVPYLIEFSMRTYFSRNQIISEELQCMVNKSMEIRFKDLFPHVDYSKFKDDVNPEEIYKMLVWMSDGYFNEKQRKEEPIVVDDLLEKFDKWIQMLKKVSYREEYLR